MRVTIISDRAVLGASDKSGAHVGEYQPGCTYPDEGLISDETAHVFVKQGWAVPAEELGTVLSASSEIPLATQDLGFTSTGQLIEEREEVCGVEFASGQRKGEICQNPKGRCKIRGHNERSAKEQAD